MTTQPAPEKLRIPRRFGGIFERDASVQHALVPAFCTTAPVTPVVCLDVFPPRAPFRDGLLQRLVEVPLLEADFSNLRDSPEICENIPLQQLGVWSKNKIVFDILCHRTRLVGKLLLLVVFQALWNRRGRQEFVLSQRQRLGGAGRLSCCTRRIAKMLSA